jgi:hypothetical protein
MSTAITCTQLKEADSNVWDQRKRVILSINDRDVSGFDAPLGMQLRIMSCSDIALI